MENNEELQEIEDPQWTKYRINEELKQELEVKIKMAEMDKQIAYSEKLQLTQLKLEAFKLAKGLLINDDYSKPILQQTSEDLIHDAEKIYKSLISTTITSKEVAEEKSYSVQDNSFAFTDWLDSKEIAYTRSGHQTIILGEVDIFDLGKEWAAYKFSSVYNSVTINK